MVTLIMVLGTEIVEVDQCFVLQPNTNLSADNFLKKLEQELKRRRKEVKALRRAAKKNKPEKPVVDVRMEGTGFIRFQEKDTSSEESNKSDTDSEDDDCDRDRLMSFKPSVNESSPLPLNILSYENTCSGVDSNLPPPNWSNNDSYNDNYRDKSDTDDGVLNDRLMSDDAIFDNRLKTHEEVSDERLISDEEVIDDRLKSDNPTAIESSSLPNNKLYHSTIDSNVLPDWSSSDNSNDNNSADDNVINSIINRLDNKEAPVLLTSSWESPVNNRANGFNLDDEEDSSNIRTVGRDSSPKRSTIVRDAYSPERSTKAGVTSPKRNTVVSNFHRFGDNTEGEEVVDISSDDSDNDCVNNKQSSFVNNKQSSSKFLGWGTFCDETGTHEKRKFSSNVKGWGTFVDEDGQAEKRQFRELNTRVDSKTE